jgi:hypothetical protein
MKARAGEQFYPAECKRRKDDPGRRRNPPPWALTKLPPKYEVIVRLMIYGLEEDAVIEGVAIAAGTPLTLRQAARRVGVRLRSAREIADTALFQTAFNKTLLSLRRSEGPRNLHTAIKIRDDEGDCSAATKRARLAAIDSIEGKSSTGTNISVSVNSQTNVSAGYIIRLPQTSPPVIDGEAIEQD